LAQFGGVLLEKLPGGEELFKASSAQTHPPRQRDGTLDFFAQRPFRRRPTRMGRSRWMAQFWGVLLEKLPGGEELFKASSAQTHPPRQRGGTLDFFAQRLFRRRPKSMRTARISRRFSGTSALLEPLGEVRPLFRRRFRGLRARVCRVDISRRRFVHLALFTPLRRQVRK
jgi:hypothetical protein